MAGSAAAGRLWLDVPFTEKDEAKRLGARWDPAVRRWYAPRPRMPGLERWAALPELPRLLPGEDRSFGPPGLFVDLVPQTCWFTHVRSCVSERDWDRLRRMVFERAEHCCEACGRSWVPGFRLEAHERWAFDQTRRVQSLRRLICLCSDCHTATHFGLAELRGMGPVALAHLRVVTGMSEQEARVHIGSAYRLWRKRSQHEWTLDLGMLTDVGVTVVWPPEPAQRAEMAAAQTDVVRAQDDGRAELAAEMVRVMRAQGMPVDQTDTVWVRLPGGVRVPVDPRRV